MSGTYPFEHLLIPVSAFSFTSQKTLNVQRYLDHEKELFEIRALADDDFSVKYIVKMYDIGLSNSQKKKLSLLPVFSSRKEARDDILEIIGLCAEEVRFEQVGMSFSKVRLDQKFHGVETVDRLSIVGRAKEWHMHLYKPVGLSTEYLPHLIHRVEATTRQKVVEEAHKYLSIHLYQYYCSLKQANLSQGVVNFQNEGKLCPWLFFVRPELDLKEIFN